MLHWSMRKISDNYIAGIAGFWVVGTKAAHTWPRWGRQAPNFVIMVVSLRFFRDCVLFTLSDPSHVFLKLHPLSYFLGRPTLRPDGLSLVGASEEVGRIQTLCLRIVRAESRCGSLLFFAVFVFRWTSEKKGAERADVQWSWHYHRQFVNWCVVHIEFGSPVQSRSINLPNHKL